MLIFGTGMGLTSAPATEASMGAVPEAKAGVGSAVNDATRLFGGTLGVAVIGNIAASLYSSRLVSTAPARLPLHAVATAKASVGGAFIASHILTKDGLVHAGNALATSATGAFLHSLAGGCVVAAGVSVAGAIGAALFLPARPKREDPEQSQTDHSPPRAHRDERRSISDALTPTTPHETATREGVNR